MPVLIVLLLSILAIGSSGYLYYRNFTQTQVSKNPPTSSSPISTPTTAVPVTTSSADTSIPASTSLPVIASLMLSSSSSSSTADIKSIAISSLAVSAHGPVELHVYDAHNRHTGPNSFGDIEIGIPQSNYDNIELNYFINLPVKESPYRIEVRSVKNAVADLEISGLGAWGLSIIPKNLLISYLEIPFESSTVAYVNLDLSQNKISKEALVMVVNNLSGNEQLRIAPTAILTGAEANDIFPPIITMPTIPSIIKAGDAVTFNFSATDDLSGVAYVNGSLDGNTIKSGDVVTFSQAKDYLLRISASDNAGNPRIKDFTFKVTE